MRFDTAQADLREMPERLSRLRERLKEVQRITDEVREARRNYDQARPLGKDEWLREQRHIHPISEENLPHMEKVYEQYFDGAHRNEEAALSHLDTSRHRMLDKLGAVSQELLREVEQTKELLRELEAFQDPLVRAKQGFEQNPRLLSAEQITSATFDLLAHDWLKL